MIGHVGREPQAPRTAERLLRWSLAPIDRPAVLGDLQEEFATLVDERGRTIAVRWYWQQTFVSVGPNVTRRVRQAWRRIFATEEARQRRSSNLKWAGIWLLLGVLDGWTGGPIRHVFGWRAAAPDLWFVLLWLVMAVFPIPQPDLARPFALFAVCGLIASWAAVWARLAFQGNGWLMAAYAIGSVALYLPIRTWTGVFRRQAIPYSVRIPVVAGRQGPDLRFGTEPVPRGRLAMARAIVGFSAPPTEETASLPVPVLVPTIARTFTSDQTVRVFTVVNGAPSEVQSRAELRSTTAARLIGIFPVTARPATPGLPVSRRADAWYYDPLTLPKSELTELDATISFRDVPAGPYVARLVATDGVQESHEDVEIVVRPANRQAKETL